MKKYAVLIGRNYMTILGLARAFGVAGYSVGVLRLDRADRGRTGIRAPLESRCKYVSKYVTTEFVDSYEVIDTVIRNFSRSDAKPILVPVEDISAELLDNHLHVLQEHFYLPNINNQQGAIVQLMDKGYQRELAKKFGLNIPAGWSVKIENGSYEFPNDVPYPCFVKPETPIYGRKAYTRKCDNEQELKTLLDQVASKCDCSIAVEEYMKIEKEYAIDGVSSGNAVCIPAIIDEEIMGEGSHTGVTCVGSLLHPEVFAEDIDKLKKMLIAVGFKGMFAIDIYRANGKIYFCELNVRLGSSGVVLLPAGVNLAQMLGDVLSGEDSQQNYDAVCQELRFANERPNLDNYSDGFISVREYMRRMKQVDLRCIKDKDDRKPYYSYLYSLLVQVALKLLRK